jgi:hypothetical protein
MEPKRDLASDGRTLQIRQSQSDRRSQLVDPLSGNLTKDLEGRVSREPSRTSPLSAPARTQKVLRGSGDFARSLLAAWVNWSVRFIRMGMDNILT